CNGFIRGAMDYW
nr:immunoglobulin heavy chain junction region [Mus musculus]NSM05577.1 immunoglobulin heavy chain junction region [Mus musculus]